MLLPLLTGSLTIVINMVIQVLTVVILIRFLAPKQQAYALKTTVFHDTWILSFALAVLFAGNLIQCAIWAVLFIFLGEFQIFATAFYHSSVNFASLGYGDIVMSERWRLLGALEAANGVLMFGLTAGTMFSMMQRMAQRHQPKENSQ
ncbi:MAG: two pore domain potassium channel family protein [Gammaproteobacteria bacterium]|nr:two pore domain potassium channel family protein [Gammaproteobacteria bacterium]MBQ0839686.1 two pore domain potassium channel family protein [Gammaproteobacteria bacterium]